MYVVEYDEIDGLPDIWIKSEHYLPPPGLEVIVETRSGKVTALARFVRHDECLPEDSWWDNAYPGKGNMHLFESIIHWRKLPKGKEKE